MKIQSDYVLRLIEEMGAVISQAMQRLGLLDAREPVEVAGQVIGLALDMDPGLAAQLSPQSLVSLLKIGDADSRVVELVAQALELEAQALEARGEVAAAEGRRDGATEVRSLLA